MVSVAVRFAIAAVIIGIWCWLNKISLVLPRRQHKWVALAGLFLYTLDYSFLYAAQHHMISALLAVLSSSVIYFNVILRRIVMKKPIRMEVVCGATVGLIGIVLIFLPEFAKLNLHQSIVVGLMFASGSFFCAAMGNVLSEKILDGPTSVLQLNFWGMSYGVVFTSIVSLLSGASFVLPSNANYYYALIYLAVFGSVLAFGAYMKLLTQIGADKSAYVVLVYPVVALIISTFFEGYQWTIAAIVGVLSVLVGNAIAMGKLNFVFSQYKSV